MTSLPLPLDILIFAAAAAGVWIAGTSLSKSTDVLSMRLGLGEALGGVILLAIVTNLPEIAIVVSASISGALDVATGNILGGIAIQTVVLVVLDVFGVKGKRPLTYLSASLTLVLEAGLVIAVLVVVVMGSRLPHKLALLNLDPAAVLIALLWIAGIWLVSRARRGLPWHDEHGDAPDTQEHPRGHAKEMTERDATDRGVSTARVAFRFGVGAVVTLIGGALLEQSGTGIATHIHMSGVLFGSTFLAAATALPEVSTGLAAVKLGDYQLAVSDIFGGNAFLPVLFLVASLISGQSVLPLAQSTDIYLTGLGALLTVVYIGGLIFRPKRRIARMGVDSLAVLVLYVLGLVGLVAIALS